MQAKPLDDIDNFFKAIENRVDEKLADKLLADFHGNPVLFDDSVKNKQPVIDLKSQIKIASIIQSQDAYALRIEIIGGGCAGFKYDFSLIDKKDINADDTIINADPICVVDNQSITYLWGATIKWEDNLTNSGLTVENPGAKQSCGCGTSFTLSQNNQ